MRSASVSGICIRHQPFTEPTPVAASYVKTQTLVLRACRRVVQDFTKQERICQRANRSLAAAADVANNMAEGREVCHAASTVCVKPGLQAVGLTCSRGLAGSGGLENMDSGFLVHAGLPTGPVSLCSAAAACS